MEPSTLTIGTPNATGNGNVQFARYNADGTYATTVKIDSSGNVGIGTTSPGAKLAVAGDVSMYDAHVRGYGVVGAGVASSGIQMYGDAVAHANIAWMPNEHTFAFHTGNGARATTDYWGPANVTISGSVGIGTTAPATTLDVNGVANAATGFRVANAAANGNYLRGDGTNFVSGAMQAGDIATAAGGTPALTLGTANSAGSANTFVRTDATLLAFDATAPAALGTPAAGSASVAARRDHVHPAADLANTSTTGVLPVAKGGTGATTLTGMLKGNAASAVTAVTGTANYVAKWSDANTIAASSLLYDNGTNIGIGTASPFTGYKLTVAGDGKAARFSAGDNVNSQNFGGNTPPTGAKPVLEVRTQQLTGWPAVTFHYENILTSYLSVQDSPRQFRLESTPSEAVTGLYVQGNVGIGTTGPLSKLTVGPPAAVGNSNYTIYGENANAAGTAIYGYNSSTDNSNDFAIYGRSKAGYGVVGYSESTNSQAAVLGQGTSGPGVSGSSSSGNGGYFTSASGYALITGAGNVGIGTTSPGTKLEVAGDVSMYDAHIRGYGVVGAGVASSGIQMYGDAVAHANIAWMPNEHTFAFHTGNGARATTDYWGPANVTISGNVGIGTSGPRLKLDVNGPLIAGVSNSIDAISTYYTPYIIGASNTNTNSTGNGFGPNIWTIIGSNNSVINNDNGGRVGYIVGDSNTIGQAMASQAAALDDFYVFGKSNILRETSSGRKEMALGFGNSINSTNAIVVGNGITSQADSSVVLGWGAPTVNILNTGNVGIGTAGPVAKLQITAGSEIYSGGTYGSHEGLWLGSYGSNGGAKIDLNTHTSSISNSSWRIQHETDNTAAGNLVFLYAPTQEARSSLSYTEYLRINSSGNVGIGTTNPSVKLDVNGSLKANKIFVEMSGTTDGPYFFKVNGGCFEGANDNCDNLCSATPGGQAVKAWNRASKLAIPTSSSGACCGCLCTAWTYSE